MVANENLAWLAGFWDGEGCVTLVKNHPTPVFSLSQAGEEGKALCQRVLDSCNITGSVNGPYIQRGNQPYYKVRISGLDRVSKLVIMCWPWLSDTKQKQAWTRIVTAIGLRKEMGILRKELRKNCPKGHPYDENNTAYTKEGWRRCKQCHRECERRRGASAYQGVRSEES